MLVVSVSIAGSIGFTPEYLDSIAAKFGDKARDKLVNWQNLIENSQGYDDFQKLYTVNFFFNKVPFISDMKHWHLNDYWATPIEFLTTNGGDCEDFAIAKYFTLRELGVPDEKLRITYVKALKLNQAHMVLAYYVTPESDPLILDNLIPEIRPASQRDDLLPIYSFNGKDLWMSKERGQGRQVAGGSGRINLWRDLKVRLKQERNLGKSYTTKKMMQ
ncbi:MAG: transglutaminase-like cysteine peptidase [Mariprofundaceae bacterium]|nr:transglutaminase-like cysteine peptidase [Mariprofundaceae bacterium]